MLGRQKHWLKISFILAVSFFLASCTSLEVDHGRPLSLAYTKRIVVLPFANMTETPQADERAVAITANMLRTKGLVNVYSYPYKPTQASLIPGVKKPIPRSRLIAFAKRKNANLALIGNVTEWNYKVGLDGEPAIGLNMEIVDIHTNQVLWSSVGSKSGGSRTALSSVAQVLVEKMLDDINVIGPNYHTDNGTYYRPRHRNFHQTGYVKYKS